MNWGYKLMLAFVLFAAMMSYLVFRCFQTDFELVEKEYYKSELVYQQVIDGTERAKKLSTAPAIQQSGKALILQMPDEMKDTAVKGSVWFYCAYDSGKDKKYHLSLNENGMQVLGNGVTPGSYVVKIDWSSKGKNYYTEQHLTVL
ncbi:MAG: FixH family protein [Agriterribacter sp.]